MRLEIPFSPVPPRPKVLSAAMLVVALALHVAAFAVFWAVAVAQGLFEKKETVIPIDLTVIVNENLDGVEGEPPPLLNPPEPEPPKPKAKKPEPPKPKPKDPEKPKPLEQIVTNVVVKAEKDKDKKKDRDKDRKKDPKADEKKKPEAPKKTAAELRKERMERIRSRAKVVNGKKVAIEVPDAKESGNGRTGRQTLSKAEIRRLLDQGYRPGTENSLATSEKQRCLSLVQMAIEDRWDKMMPKIGREGSVLLSVRFNSAGGLVDVRLQRSCGDALSDQAALSVARSVTSIRGLSAEFLSEFRKEPLTVFYRVRGR